MSHEDWRKRVTIKTVIAAHRLDKFQYPLFLRWCLLPLSWPITGLFVRAGVTPGMATFLRWLIGLASVAMMACPHSEVWKLGIGIYWFALILDHVDGNISRVSDGGSYFGKYWDGMVDQMIDQIVPLSLGWIAYQNGAPVGVLLLGVFASTCGSLLNLTKIRFGMISNMMKSDLGAQSKKELLSTGSLWKKIYGNKSYQKLAEFIDGNFQHLMAELRYMMLAYPLVTGDLIGICFFFAGLEVLNLLTFFPVRFIRVMNHFSIYRENQSTAISLIKKFHD